MLHPTSSSSLEICSPKISPGKRLTLRPPRSFSHQAMIFTSAAMGLLAPLATTSGFKIWRPLPPWIPPRSPSDQGRLEKFSNRPGACSRPCTRPPGSRWHAAAGHSAVTQVKQSWSTPPSYSIATNQLAAASGPAVTLAEVKASNFRGAGLKNPVMVWYASRMCFGAYAHRAWCASSPRLFSKTPLREAAGLERREGTLRGGCGVISFLPGRWVPGGGIIVCYLCPTVHPLNKPYSVVECASRRVKPLAGGQIGGLCLCVRCVGQCGVLQQAATLLTCLSPQRILSCPMHKAVI